MSTQENGQPELVLGNLPASVPILSSTLATPIAITTNGSHGLTSGDAVHIVGHTNNNPANGRRIVTVSTPTTFTIADYQTGAPVAGTGVGGATGTVQSLGTGVTFPIPADGVDTVNAASVGVPFDALADRTAFTVASMGAYAPVAFGHYENGGGSGLIYILSPSAADTWLFLDTATGGGGYTTPTLTGLCPGDIVEFEIYGTYAAIINTWTSGNYVIMGPAISFYTPSGSESFAAAITGKTVQVTGSTFSDVTTGPYRPFSLQGQEVVPSGTSVAGLAIGVLFHGGTGSPNVALYDSIQFRWRVWRPTYLSR